jgi:competence protein ComEA
MSSGLVVTIDDMSSISITPEQRRLLMVAVLLVLAVVVAFRYAPRGASGSGSAAPIPAVVPAARPPTRPLTVDVVGAVARPGLYRLARGARIADAVTRAGGATRRADLEQVNLAAPLADGEQIVVPRRGAATASASASAAPGSPTAPVQLSTATAEQLDALPGIGPVTAQKIVAYRQQHGAFSSVAGLDAIPGIGPARIDQLKGLVVP